MSMPKPEKYIVKYPEKYCGPLHNGYIIARSSWEKVFFRMLDSPNKSILYWSSESITIKFINPFTKKVSSYIPDLFIVYIDRTGKKHAEVIEIKPLAENGMVKYDGKMTARLKLIRELNMAKWAAAFKWCAKNGMTFRICTEKDLFAKPVRRAK